MDRLTRNGWGSAAALGWRAGACAAALAASALVLLAVGTSPFAALRAVAGGALGSTTGLGYVLTAWAPLLLCSAGLLLTFRAGLWNIGIEGQVVLGAIGAALVLRAFGTTDHPGWVLAASAGGGALAGALWAQAPAVLKHWGGVHEIFGGLACNYVAVNISLYLVFGPWKQAGIASMSGTAPFAENLRLVPLAATCPVSLTEVLLALAALVAVAALLEGTSLGLRLKAVGANPRSAELLGICSRRCLFSSFALCGALAGLAGWVLIAGASARHTFFPLISSGYGFLGILVVLLADFRPGWSAVVAFFFAALGMGSLQLSVQLGIESSVGGVVQGLLALFFLLARGVADRLRRQETSAPAPGPPSPEGYRPSHAALPGLKP